MLQSKQRMPNSTLMTKDFCKCLRKYVDGRPSQVKGKVNDSLLAVQVLLLIKLMMVDDCSSSIDDDDDDVILKNILTTLTQRLQSTTLRLTSSAFTCQSFR